MKASFQWNNKNTKKVGKKKKLSKANPNPPEPADQKALHTNKELEQVKVTELTESEKPKLPLKEKPTENKDAQGKEGKASTGVAEVPLEKKEQTESGTDAEEDPLDAYMKQVAKEAKRVPKRRKVVVEDEEEYDGVSFYEERNKKIGKLRKASDRAFKAGNSEKALEALDEAIQLTTNDHALYAKRSGALSHLKSYQQALDDAEQAIKLQPRWPPGYARQAAALRGLGKKKEAVKARSKESELHFQARDFDKALSAVDLALTLDDSNAHLRSQRAKALLKLERFDEALEEGTKVMDLNPLLVDGYCHVADAHTGMGNTADAKTTARQGLEKIPGSWSLEQILLS